MTIVLGVLYLAGWLGTTALLLRPHLTTDAQGRDHRRVLGVVGMLSAMALAAVWPISGWFLPLIRAGLQERD